MALVLSLMGVRNSPRKGLAIAGIVIGTIQSVILVWGLVWLFFLGGLAIWGTKQVVDIAEQEGVKEALNDTFDKATTIINRAQSRFALTDAAKSIDAQTIATGSLPGEVVGTELIKHFKDVWEKPFRYRHSNAQPATYSIESAGQDGVWESGDDFVMTFPSLIPTNVYEALGLLGDRDEQRQRAALEWLARATPTDVERDRVINAVFQLPSGSSLQELKWPVLKRWLNEKDLPRLITMLDRIGSGEEMANIVDVFVEHNSVEGLLKLLNHSDVRIQREVDRALRKLGATDEQIVRACMADLDSDDRANRAFARLNSMSIGDELGREVAKGIFQAVRDMRFGFDKNVADAVQLAVQCDPKAVDRNLIRSFVVTLGRPGTQSNCAARALETLGPIVESQVLDAAETANDWSLSEICQVLEKVGTERSLPVLKKLAEDSRNGADAQKAIESIEKAKREPVDLVD